MAILDQVIDDKYALYCGDCVETMDMIPDGRVHLSIYSPPFGTPKGGLFAYSSSDRDISNSFDYKTFMEHYAFVVRQISRVTMPGRISGVHCMDTPTGNTGSDTYTDFPGDIIRLHAEHGFDYCGRHCVWKEPLGVRNRTMAKNLMHGAMIDDSSLCGMAAADYLLIFRKRGRNPVPVWHPTGLMEYAGSRPVPPELRRFRGWDGNQIENRYSHWIWRQYASAFWDDVRIDRVVPFEQSRDENDEKHIHPLQLDVIDRIVVLRSNPGEIVLTPFMGVGSEVYSAVLNRRKGLGVELKPSYFRQAAKNVAAAASGRIVQQDQASMGFIEDQDDPWFEEMAEKRL